MSSVDFGLYLMYFVFGTAIAVSIILPLINLLKNPKDLIKVSIIIGGFILLFFLGYTLSGANLSIKHISMGVSESDSKMMGAGIIMLYIFLIGSILAIIMSEVSKFFK